MKGRNDITNRTDEKLMALLSSKRSNEALTELHARYANKTLGYFIRMFKGDAEKAQDFVQELFMRILEKHELFDQNKKFYTWMFTIASNMCKTEFRKRPDASLSNDGYEAEQNPNWEENQIDKEVFRSALKKSISKLDEHHRSTFVLRYIEGMSTQDIADTLEVSKGTVKSRLFYGTKKITNDLKEFDPKGEGSLFKMK